jgi:hypothetical protein
MQILEYIYEVVKQKKNEKNLVFIYTSNIAILKNYYKEGKNL